MRTTTDKYLGHLVQWEDIVGLLCVPARWDQSVPVGTKFRTARRAFTDIVEAIMTKKEASVRGYYVARAAEAVD